MGESEWNRVMWGQGPRWMIDHLPRVLEFANNFLIEPTAGQIANWERWRDDLVKEIGRWIFVLMQYAPPLLSLSHEVTPAERAAHERDERAVLSMLRRLREATPPRAPTAAPSVAPVVDPRDGDGWEDAVSKQGVRITYDGYLQSTHWELLRAERLTGTCERCHRAKRTQLHHVTYERLGAEQPNDTRELCDRCHQREHPRQLKLAA
jgi:hypothetical protein